MPAPSWVVESCDADSTDDTEIVTHYGQSSYFPYSGLSVQLVQRESTRDGLTLNDPPTVLVELESTMPGNRFFVSRDIDVAEIPALISALSDLHAGLTESRWAPQD